MNFCRPLLIVSAVSCVSICGAADLSDKGAEENSRERYCQKVLCREPTTVRVILKDGKVSETVLHEGSPVVLPNGWITIFPGEEVRVAFEVEGNQIRNPTAIELTEKPSNTLSFRFKQESEGKSLLAIESTFPKTIKLNLGVMLPDSERIVKTSSCPILPGGESYEMWPYPIFQIVAAGVRQLPDDDPMTCE